MTYLWLGFSDNEDSISLDLLSVRGNSINVLWARRLNFKICNLIKARHVDLGSNNFSDKGAKELAVYFTKNDHL